MSFHSSKTKIRGLATWWIWFILFYSLKQRSGKTFCFSSIMIFHSLNAMNTFQIDELSKVILNIGIKHGFLCINICWAPREMLQPEPERRGFQPLLRGPADVNVSEKHV